MYGYSSIASKICFLHVLEHFKTTLIHDTYIMWLNNVAKFKNTKKITQKGSIKWAIKNHLPVALLDQNINHLLVALLDQNISHLLVGRLPVLHSNTIHLQFLLLHQVGHLQVCGLLNIKILILQNSYATQQAQVCSYLVDDSLAHEFQTFVFLFLVASTTYNTKYQEVGNVKCPPLYPGPGNFSKCNPPIDCQYSQRQPSSSSSNYYGAVSWVLLWKYSQLLTHIFSD